MDLESTFEMKNIKKAFYCPLGQFAISKSIFFNFVDN
jgi:hypothetical protein